MFYFPSLHRSEPGKFLFDWNATKGSICDNCPLERWSHRGAPACDMCRGSLRDDTGTSGFVMLPQSSNQTQDLFPGAIAECAPCTGKLEGLDCRKDGQNLISAPLREGYWRASPLSSTTHLCADDWFCPGLTLDIDLDSEHARNASSNMSWVRWAKGSPEDPCAVGHTGPLCQVSSARRWLADQPVSWGWLVGTGLKMVKILAMEALLSRGAPLRLAIPRIQHGSQLLPLPLPGVRGRHLSLLGWSL